MDDSDGATEAMSSPSRSAGPVGSAMALLRCFGEAVGPLGVTELAARVGRDKSSVSRMLATLEQEELLERDPSSGKYLLGLGLLALASPLLADLDVRRVARPVLARLTAATGETAALLVWSGRAAITVEQSPSPAKIRHDVQLGAAYAETASSSVRSFLAALPEPAVRRLLERGEIASAEPAEAVLARIARERAEGVHVNDGATHPEEVGVAASVRDRSGEVCAAVLVSAPRYRTGPERIAEIAAAAREAARELSIRLGAPLEALRPEDPRDAGA